MNKLNIYINESLNFPKDYILSENSKNKFKFSLTKEKKRADILFIRLSQKYNEDEIKKFNNLKIICSSTTGLTHIDRSYIKKKGIKLISLEGESNFLSKIKTTAELALSMILASQTLTISSSIDVYKGSFNREKFFRKSFKDTSIGILGFGRLGRMTAEYLLSLGFEVYFYDKKNISLKRKNLKKCNSIDELFKNCNIISIHVNYKDENRNLINRNLLCLNPPYKLINTSRAEIFDSNEIHFCFENGLLEQYLTDVLEEEPFKNNESVNLSKLWLMQKKYGINSVIITPHIGGACWSSLYKCELFLIDKLLKELYNSHYE